MGFLIAVIGIGVAVACARVAVSLLHNGTRREVDFRPVMSDLASGLGAGSTPAVLTPAH